MKIKRRVRKKKIQNYCLISIFVELSATPALTLGLPSVVLNDPSPETKYAAPGVKEDCPEIVLPTTLIVAV